MTECSGNKCREKHLVQAGTKIGPRETEVMTSRYATTFAVWVYGSSWLWQMQTLADSRWHFASGGKETTQGPERIT